MRSGDRRFPFSLQPLKSVVGWVPSRGDLLSTKAIIWIIDWTDAFAKKREYLALRNKLVPLICWPEV
jgi:hypothetical protein